MTRIRPLFLARAEYRRRRLRDAARLLPVVGVLLFLMPILWHGAPGAPGTARGGIYLFVVWGALIAAAAALASALSAPAADESDAGMAEVLNGAEDPHPAAPWSPGADRPGHDRDAPRRSGGRRGDGPPWDEPQAKVSRPVPRPVPDVTRVDPALRGDRAGAGRKPDADAGPGDGGESGAGERPETDGEPGGGRAAEAGQTPDAVVASATDGGIHGRRKLDTGGGGEVFLEPGADGVSDADRKPDAAVKPEADRKPDSAATSQASGRPHVTGKPDACGNPDADGAGVAFGLPGAAGASDADGGPGAFRLPDADRKPDADGGRDAI